MIELVYFDVGGTLIDPYPSVGEVYAAAGRRHGLDASPEELGAAFQQAWRRRTRAGDESVLVMGRDPESTHVWWRALVFDVLRAVGFTGDLEACYQDFFRAFERPEAWRIHEDVLPALEGLAAGGVRMGVLSNWDHRLPPLLDALDLARWFDPILVSALEGVAKPDVRFYERAVKRSGLPAERLLHVGDRADLDLVPARAAGMEAKLLDRSGTRRDEATIDRLTELLTLVGQYGGS